MTAPHFLGLWIASAGIVGVAVFWWRTRRTGATALGIVALAALALFGSGVFGYHVVDDGDSSPRVAAQPAALASAWERARARLLTDEVLAIVARRRAMPGALEAEALDAAVSLQPRLGGATTAIVAGESVNFGRWLLGLAVADFEARMRYLVQGELAADLEVLMLVELARAADTAPTQAEALRLIAGENDLALAPVIAADLAELAPRGPEAEEPLARARARVAAAAAP